MLFGGEITSICAWNCRYSDIKRVFHTEKRCFTWNNWILARITCNRSDIKGEILQQWNVSRETFLYCDMLMKIWNNFRFFIVWRRVEMIGFAGKKRKKHKIFTKNLPKPIEIGWNEQKFAKNAEWLLFCTNICFTWNKIMPILSFWSAFIWALIGFLLGFFCLSFSLFFCFCWFFVI